MTLMAQVPKNKLQVNHEKKWRENITLFCIMITNELGILLQTKAELKYGGANEHLDFVKAS